MLIGQLADALGIPTKTVRFYERKGLLPDPERAENGNRVCSHVDALLERSRQLDPADCTAGEICHIFTPTEIAPS